MDHLHALAAAVADNPGDFPARRVLADALEELGHTGAAAVLRQPGYWVVAGKELWWTNHERSWLNNYPLTIMPELRDDAVLVHLFDVPPRCQPCALFRHAETLADWHSLLFGWICQGCSLQYHINSQQPCPVRYP